MAYTDAVVAALRIFSRDQWGADPDLPRRGYLVGASRREEVFIHHTTLIDGDASANEWNGVDEVFRQMRRLQTVRPDLGLDVPYSMVAFCMADGDLVLCEGRGLFRTGAHTRNHNRSALGIAFQGNFDSYAVPRHLPGQLVLLSRWLGTLRRERGFDNLGRLRPPGREVWGHRDIAATVCPGRALFERLDQIRFVREDDEMLMDKPTWKRVQRALQLLDPPLYGGKAIDGLPGRNTNLSLQAFERRIDFGTRGVMGELNDPEAGMWPATRELLFSMTTRP